MRLFELKTRIDGAGFNCVLDRIVFECLARIYPGADYVRIKKELAAEALNIAASLEGVAAGDYDRAALFAGGSRKDVFGKMEGIEYKLSRLSACSRFNSRLQFLFWDAFLNPGGLELAPRGVAARNKLLY